MLFVRGVHSLKMYCVTVYGSISILFQPREFAFLLPEGATISAKLQMKIAKSPKFDRKVCAYHFV